MAMVRKCDRCGKVYEHYEGHIRDYPLGANAISYMYVGKYDVTYERRAIPIDLCRECYGSFMKWMEEKKEEE